MGQLIGYVRCSTDRQDLTAQRQQLRQLSVTRTGSTSTTGSLAATGTGPASTRPSPPSATETPSSAPSSTGSPGPCPTPAASSASSPPAASGSRSAAPHTTGPNPFGRMFLQTLAVIAEFEVDLQRQRTREGMAVARANGKLKGRKPKFTGYQQTQLTKLHAEGGHTISDLAGMFGISRSAVYRALDRQARMAS